MSAKISRHAGHLEVYYGPMFSGKTCKLHLRLSEFADPRAGLRTCYLNSAQDVRQPDAEFSTNCSSGTTALSARVKSFKVSNLRSATRIPEVACADVIGIDESQLFEDLIEVVKEWVDQCKIVIVVGLSGSYLMEKYGKILDLIPMADYSEQLTAHCEACLLEGLAIDRSKQSQASNPGLFNSAIINKASFTLRLIDDSGETVIGGAQIYAGVCRYHHQLLSKMTEAERMEFMTPPARQEREEQSV